MSTKTFTDTYKGHPTIAVWEVDESGEKTGKYPIVSLGKRKAKAIAEHTEAFTAFANKEDTEDK